MAVPDNPTLKRRDQRKHITTHTNNTTSSLLALCCTAEQRLTVNSNVMLSNLVYNSTLIGDIIYRWCCPRWHILQGKVKDTISLASSFENGWGNASSLMIENTYCVKVSTGKLFLAALHCVLVVKSLEDETHATAKNTVSHQGSRLWQFFSFNFIFIGKECWWFFSSQPVNFFIILDIMMRHFHYTLMRKKKHTHKNLVLKTSEMQFWKTFYCLYCSADCLLNNAVTSGSRWGAAGTASACKGHHTHHTKYTQ